MSQLVTFVVDVCKTPPVEVDGFFAMYLSGGQSYKPKWLKPDGTIEEMPVGNFVSKDSLLVFENVPCIGKLVPAIHSSEEGVGILVNEKIFDDEEPALNGAKYLIDFWLTADVDEGEQGKSCPQCHGIGYVW